MSLEPKKLILVAGAPRSGTTAVGRVLSLPHGVGALHEPFNYLVGMSDIERYFEIPGSKDFTQQKLDDCLAKLESLRIKLKPGVFPRDKGMRRFAKQIVGGRAALSYRSLKMNPFLRTIIWKDPFASFSSRYLVASRRSHVVVLVRNPFAVAASFKRMGWRFEIEDILQRLGSAGMAEVDVKSTPAWQVRSAPAANGALLWRAIYEVLGRWAAESDRFHVVDLDRVVADPVETYESLYPVLDLKWDDSIGRRIAAIYRVKDGPRVPKSLKAHDRNRDVRAVNEYWSDVLDADEISCVEGVTGALWDRLSSASI